MIQLLTNYNAVRWTAETMAIKDAPFFALLTRAYGRNRIAGSGGFVGFDRNDLFPSLTTFVKGEDYLINMLGPYQWAGGVLAPAGTFAAFPGYVPVGVGDATTPVNNSPSIPGTVNAQVAAVDIIGGRLVARVEQGLVPYSTLTAEKRYLLFGFALNSALAGGIVQVQRNGYVQYPGLGLKPNATLLAGDEGHIVYSSDGLAIHHVIGRSTTDDSFVFSSSLSSYSL